MFTTLLLLAACFEEGSSVGAVSTPTWHSVYGECTVGTILAVSAEDLGEPVSLLVEIERTSGWIPITYSPWDDLSSPTIYRTEDGGLALACPQGSSGWHVAWGSL